MQALANQPDGTICLTGGSRGLLNQLLSAGAEQAAATWLQGMRELFPGRLYVELQFHSEGDRRLVAQLSRLAARTRLPTVATQDVFYLNPEQAGLQRTMAAIRQNQPVGELGSQEIAPPGAHFTGEAEMARRFIDQPRALAATQEITERCQLELPLGVARFPSLELAEGETPITVLTARSTSRCTAILCSAGWQKWGRGLAG